MLIRVYKDSAPSFSISRSPKKKCASGLSHPSSFTTFTSWPHQKPPIHPGKCQVCGSIFIVEPNQRYQEKLPPEKTAILIVVFWDMNRTITGCVFFSKNSRNKPNTLADSDMHQGWLVHSHVGHKAWGALPKKTCNVQLTFAKRWKDSETFPLFVDTSYRAWPDPLTSWLHIPWCPCNFLREI